MTNATFWSWSAMGQWMGQFFFVSACLIPVSMLFSFIDRRLVATVQARVGPNRLGPHGTLQGAGDILKLLQKGPRLEFGFWLGAVVWAFGSVLILPLSSKQIGVDSELSVFWPLAFLLGTCFWEGFLGSGRRYLSRWLAGLRGLAQGVSALFPAFISVLAQGATASSFSTQHWLSRQSAWPSGWALLEHPFAWINFMVFWISGLMAWGWSPFETFRGLWSRQGGVNFAMVTIIRFYGILSWLIFTVAFFLGGWKFGIEEAPEWIEMLIVLAKVLVLFGSMGIVRTMFFRLRADQATSFAWEVLTPLSLTGLLGSLAWALLHG